MDNERQLFTDTELILAADMPQGLDNEALGFAEDEEEEEEEEDEETENKKRSKPGRATIVPMQFGQVRRHYPVEQLVIDNEENSSETNEQPPAKRQRLEGGEAWWMREDANDADSSHDNSDNEHQHRQSAEAEEEREEDECFGCLYGQRRHAKTSRKEVKALFQILDDNCGKIPIESVAKMMAMYYHDEIYQPTIDRGQHLPRWSWKSIHTHIEEHMRAEPRIYLMKTKLLWIDLMEAMQNHLVGRDDQGRSYLIPTNIRLFKDVSNHILSLYATDPRKMVGYDENMGLSMTNLSRYINSSNIQIT